MTTIQPRSFWGAVHDDGDLTLSGLAEEVFIHHSVTAQLSPFAAVSQEIAQMRLLEQIGENRFGQGISYNVCVFPSGRAYQGVSFNRRGTHTGGRNSTSRSIVLMGNYEENAPTDSQLRTAQSLYHEGKGKWWKDSAPLFGHRDVSQTACPGQHVYSRLQFLRTTPLITKEEDDMTPDQVFNAVWQKDISTPNNLVAELGEKTTPLRLLKATAFRVEMMLQASKAEK